MTKVIFTLTLILFTYSLTKCARSDGVKKKDDETKMETKRWTMEAKDDQKDQDDMANIELMAIMTECNESFRIEMSYLEALNESGSFPDETDRTPKCYIRCVLEKAAVASENGQFDSARAAVMFAGDRGGKHMDDVEEMAKNCSDRRESCKCEKSYQFMKCLMEMEIMKYEKSQ